MGIRGLENLKEELSELFGEETVKGAITEMAKREVIGPRENQQLLIRPRASGQLVPALIPIQGLKVPKNTFYGDSN